MVVVVVVIVVIVVVAAATVAIAVVVTIVLAVVSRIGGTSRKTVQKLGPGKIHRNTMEQGPNTKMQCVLLYSLHKNAMLFIVLKQSNGAL